MKHKKILLIFAFIAIMLTAASYTIIAVPASPGNSSLIDTCQYAIEATATSENTGSEAIYATGAPDCDTDCSVWSGLQRSWNPANWDIRANITLQYASQFNTTNLTFFGDYDICIQRIWVLNNKTNEQLEVFSGANRDCSFTIPINAPFKVDKIRFETCGNAWTSTDAVQLCGQICIPGPEICDGKDNDCDNQIDEGFDADSDGIADCFDSCPRISNPKQEDVDQDGVGDACDKCPGSKRRQNDPPDFVDMNGCDIFQFCKKFYCSQSCYDADWKENEPFTQYPHDCVVVLIAKEGTYEPDCVPTVISDVCAN